MSGLGGELGRKVGPLPLGGWLLGVGLGLGIMYYNKRKAAAAATAPTAASYLAANTAADGTVSTPDNAPVIYSPVINLPPVIGPLPAQPVAQGNPPVMIGPLPISPVPFRPPIKPAPVHKVAPVKVAPKPVANHGTYTVAPGDTLWAIAGARLGSSLRWPALYAANAPAIERAAHAHGRASSMSGHWIYPGTVLVLP
jgi:nucleoid-associated protein YgaU